MSVGASKERVAARLRPLLTAVPGYRTLRGALWRAAYLLRRYIAWPPLFALWQGPTTLGRVWRQAVRIDDAEDPVMGYAYGMAPVQSWYLRIAEDFRRHGADGWVWEDGLGAALGDRFFHHRLTYGWLYGALGPRRFALLSGAVWLSGVVAMGMAAGVPWLGWAAAGVLVISPMLLLPLLHLGKPESLGWALLAPTLFAMMAGPAPVAGALLLLLSVLGISFAVPAGVFALALALGGALSVGELLVVGLPAGLKTVAALLLFLRSVSLDGFLEVLGGSDGGRTLNSPSYQAYLHKIGNPLTVWAWLHAVLAPAMWVAGGSFAELLAFVSPLFLMWLNFRGFRWADRATIGRLLVSVEVAFLFVHPAPTYALPLFAVLLGAHPRLILESGSLRAAQVPGLDDLAAYPYLQPIRLGREALDTLARRFDPVPEHARVLWQAMDPFGKTLGGYRHCSELLEWRLQPRGVEILPGEWLRGSQTDWYLERWTKLAPGAAPDLIAEIASEIGASHLLVTDELWATQLESWGFGKVGSFDGELLRRTCLGAEGAPEGTVHILSVPGGASVVSPPVPVERDEGQLCFACSAGRPVFVRVNAHRRWRADCDGEPVPVASARQDLVDGMRLVPERDGMLRLRFAGRWERAHV